jgi:O-antigen/teichoic acid export membrane protein
VNGRRSVQYGWTMADQIVSSGTNFVVAVLVARSVTTAEFGSFGLLVVVFMVLIGISRAWTTEPLAIRCSAPRDFADGVPFVAGTALALGVCGGVSLVVGAAILRGLSASVMTMSLFLPVLLLQDALRVSLIVTGRARAATANDAVWFVVSAVVLAASASTLTVATAVGFWGVGALIAAVLGLAQLRLRHLGQPGAWVRRHRDLGWRFSVEYLAAASIGHLLVLIVGATAGLAGAGAIRGAQVLLGPVTVLFAAVALQAVPHLSSSAGDVGSVWRLSIRLSAGLATIAAVASGVLLALPASVGEAILGDTWSPARDLLDVYLLYWIAIGISGGASIGLRSLALARRTLVVQLIVSATTLVAVAAAAIRGGPRPAVVALAACGWIAVLLWWSTWSRTARRFDSAAARSSAVGARTLSVDES